MELAVLHRNALADLTRDVAAIGDNAWDSPTPCTDWTVRDLLGHLTAEAHWLPHLLRGERLEEVGDRYEGDVLGDDPQEAWRQAAEREEAAVATPGALDGQVHTSMGLLPAETYLTQRLTDLIVHRWDLVRGLGSDTTLPVPAAQHCLEAVEGASVELSSTGLFADPVPVSSDADPGSKLLGLLGRDPTA